MNPSEIESTPTSRRRRPWMVLAAATALAGASALWIPGAEAFRGHGFGRGGDPAKMAEHMHRRVDRMLDKVGGSETQREQISGIVDAAMAELGPLKQAHREQRRAFAAALAAPEIDRVLLEELRLKGIGLADQASQRFVTAMADVAEVLTPEQRTQVAEHMKKHGHRRGGSHKRHHGGDE